MFRKPSMGRRLIGLAAATVFLFASSQSRAAFVVAAGYDLYETTQPTSLAGIPFEGVPLGTFDFGGTIGVQNVGTADTIWQRLSPASVPGPGPGVAAPIPLKLVATQLRSTIPVDLGLGLGIYFLTLQSARGGPDSLGSLSITFSNDNGGGFSSFFDVFFDIRFGALDGPIALSGNVGVTSVGTPWDRIPPLDAVTINGVNQNLNGSNNGQDFWPNPFTETGSTPFGPASHSLQSATTDATAVPAPASLSLALCGVGTIGFFGFMRHKRNTPAAAVV